MNKDVLWDRIGDACDRLKETRGAFIALVVFMRWLDWADLHHPEPDQPIRIYPEQVEEALEAQKQKPINKNTHKGQWPLAGA